MCRGGGDGGGSLLLPPECVFVVRAVEYVALLHIETLGVTLIVEDASCQLNIRFCDRAYGVVKVNHVSNHICQEIRSPHSEMRSSCVR